MAAVSRRSFLAGVALGPASLLVQRRRPEFDFVQYHNQTADSSLHVRLTGMWDAIRRDTGGRVESQVFPLNNNIQGSDPAALKLLAAGDIQFFTIMGGLLSAMVPVADVQQVPFAFRSAPEAHRAMDGPLGAYLVDEMAATGIHGFRVGAFDNGMRQVTSATRPVVAPADLRGMRMRVPAGALFDDLFRTLGAEPVVVNSIDIYSSLQSGKVDAQENPLALVDSYKLDEVVKYVSMTNHMWSGFNQLAHLPTWQRLPDDVRTVIDGHVARAVRLQRQDQEAANQRLRAELTRRGLIFNDVDQAPFRRTLGGFYQKWKERLGTKCWALLEQATGTSLA
ncbi:MAG: TRAP transporter substrate-binding protein [Acidobacteria bacterium]|nr:TRAP transporter substrate-binding protein [Acidobacteriota bacterium]